MTRIEQADWMLLAVRAEVNTAININVDITLCGSPLISRALYAKKGESPDIGTRYLSEYSPAMPREHDNFKRTPGITQVDDYGNDALSFQISDTIKAICEVLRQRSALLSCSLYLPNT